jgi:uncharacterized membrane protein
VNFTTSVEIDADPGHVWNVLTDVERWPDWTPSTRSARRLDTGPFGPDSRVRIEQPRLPAAVWQVTRFEPGTSFTWVSVRGGVRTEGHHRLVRRPDGLTVELGIAQTGALAWLAGALYGRLTRRYVALEARGLKRVCEPAA